MTAETPNPMPILNKTDYQKLVKEYIKLKESAGTQKEKDLLMERIAELQFKIAEINQKEQAQ